MKILKILATNTDLASVEQRAIRNAKKKERKKKK